MKVRHWAIQNLTQKGSKGWKMVKRADLHDQVLYIYFAKLANQIIELGQNKIIIWKNYYSILFYFYSIFIWF